MKTPYYHLPAVCYLQFLLKMLLVVVGSFPDDTKTPQDLTVTITEQNLQIMFTIRKESQSIARSL